MSTSTAASAQSGPGFGRRLGLVLLLGLGALGLVLAPSRFGGSMTYAVVTGHSMEPLMHDGALAVARARPEYHVGQAVIYDRYGGHVMHRLIFYEPGHGWVTRGVNNNWADGWFVPDDNIRGEVILSVPMVGGWLRDVIDHPVYLAGLAAVSAGLSVLPRHRRRITPQLSRGLAQSVPEPIPTTGRSSNGLVVLALCMTGLALAASMLVMARQAPVWPTQMVTLGALMMCVLGFDALESYCQDGFGLPEPDRSTVVLAGVSRRWYTGWDPDATVTTGHPVRQVNSPVELRDLADDYRLPVLHRVDLARHHRDYLLMTASGDFVWTPPAADRGSATS